MKLKNILFIILSIFLTFLILLLFLYQYLISPARLEKNITRYFDEYYGVSFNSTAKSSKLFSETIFENVSLSEPGKNYFYCKKIVLKRSFCFNIVFLKLKVIIDSPNFDYNFFVKISKPLKAVEKIKYLPLYLNTIQIENGYFTLTDFENEEFYKPEFENVNLNLSRTNIPGGINCLLTMDLKKGKIYKYTAEDNFKVDTAFSINVLKDEIDLKKLFLISKKGSLETEGRLDGLIIKKQPSIKAEIKFKKFKLEKLLAFDDRIIVDGTIKLNYPGKVSDNIKKQPNFIINTKELLVLINDIKLSLGVRGIISSDKKYRIKIKSDKSSDLGKLFSAFFNKSDIKLSGELDFETEISAFDNKIETTSNIKIKKGRISGFSLFETLSNLSGKKEFVNFVFTGSGTIKTSELKTTLKDMRIETKDFTFIADGDILKKEDIKMDIVFISKKDFWEKNLDLGKIESKYDDKNNFIKEEFKIKGKLKNPKFEFKLSDYMQRLLIKKALKQTESILKGLKK